MVHSLIAIDCPAEQHELIKDAINKTKYKFSGEREGYCIPQVSEVRFYNVRMKKEVEKQFLKDLGARNVLEKKKFDKFFKVLNARKKLPFSKRIIFNLGFWVLKKCLSLIGIKNHSFSDLERMNKFFKGWAITYYFGSINDKHVNGDEEWL